MSYIAMLDGNNVCYDIIEINLENDPDGLQDQDVLNSINVLELDEYDETILGKQWDPDNEEWIEYTPPPKYRKKLTVLEFRRLFTLDEMTNLYTQSESDIKLKVFLDDIAVAHEIDLEDPRTIEGLDYLVTQNYMTQERIDEIKQGIEE